MSSLTRNHCIDTYMFDTSVVQANVVDTRGLSQDQLSGVMKNYADGNNEGIMSDLKALRAS